VSIEQVKHLTTESGLRIVMERIPHVRSCSLGVWINRGSRHEPLENVGISHLLEHMVFKGTSRRDVKEIANSIESVGGSLDAFTSREYTCFHAKVLDEYCDFALDVLADLIDTPCLAEDQLAREKQVVYEEIRNMEDTPDDLIHQLYSETIWGGGPLGYPLLGTYETVESIGGEDLRRYLTGQYTARNMVISVAGNIDFGAVEATIRDKYAFTAARNGNGAPAAAADSQTASVPVRRHFSRACQQTHLCLGSLGMSHSDPRRYAFLLMSSIVGGGMSSRLFQRVREEEALAYVVYSFQQFYRDMGVYGVYAGVEPSRSEHAVEVIRQEYANILSQGVTAEELEGAKNQLKGQLVLGLESTTTRMFRLANFELNEEPYQPIDDVIANIQTVSLEDVADIAAQVLDPDSQYVVSLGPDSESDSAAGE